DHVATHTCLPSEFTASTAGTKSSSPDTSTAASKAPIAAYRLRSAPTRASPRGHEVVGARHEHGGVEGADRRVLDDVRHQPRVDTLLGRVLVVAAARRTAPRAAHSQL